MNDEELFSQFGKIHWMFHRYKMKNHQMLGPMGDPYRGQGRILSLLKMQPEMTQKDLSYILGIKPQSLGELLTKLEKSGYIEREQSETDRRAMIIKLTEEGRKIAEEQRESELFSCLSDSEKEELSGYLQRVIECIGKQIGDDDASFGPDMDEEEIRKFMMESMQRLKDQCGPGMHGFRGPGFM